MLRSIDFVDLAGAQPPRALHEAEKALYAYSWWQTTSDPGDQFHVDLRVP